MPVIAIVNQKGGTGKTTLSTNLAAAFAETGSVLLLDADAQGSSQDWADSRSGATFHVDMSAGPPGQFAQDERVEVRAADAGRILQDVRRARAEYDWVIIDGPAGISRITAEAVRAADLVLIPAKPSPFDVWAASTIVDAVKARQATAGGLPEPRSSSPWPRTAHCWAGRWKQLWRNTSCRRWSRGRRSVFPTHRWPLRAGRY